MTETTRSSLFPEWLNVGSEGAAVAALKLLLWGTVCFRGIPFQMEGDKYDGGLAETVKGLQRLLGFKGDDVDGNFGKATRKKFFEVYGVDINAIKGHGALTRAVYPNQAEPVEWISAD